MQNHLLDAVSQLGAHFAALGKLIITGFPGLAFADPGNWPLGAVLVPAATVLGLLAAWRYLRLRGFYGKRQYIAVTSQPFSWLRESPWLVLRLLVPVAIAGALLNPYVAGAPHRVPAGNRDYAICIADNKGMGAVDHPVDAQGQPVAAPASPVNKAAQPGATGGDEFFNESGSRMDFVRQVITHLLDKALVRSSVSLIAFQGSANVIVPLTDSPDWLADMLDSKNKYGLRVGTSSLVGRGNVDGKVSTIAACLQAAREVFERDGNPAHEKFIIYFGNGDDISSQKWMDDEIENIKKANIKGAIFGVGGAPIPIPVFKGDEEQFSGYYKFRNGKEALSGYNEANLLKLSQSTGWSYTHLEPGQMPNDDAFIQQLTDSKIVIGRWLIFNYAVEVALFVIFMIAMADTFAWIGRAVFRRRNSRRRT
jgi:hypothetical protein